MMKRLIPLLALCAPLSGCLFVAVGGATALVTSEFASNSKSETVISSNTDLVWASTKLSLSEMASDPITVRDDLRAARANIDHALITAQVETHSVDKVKISISARKLGIYSDEVAELVLHRIVQDLSANE
ncbi:MAG: hypothetical protein ACI841_004878 [Planctomycetota bacterium]|jgi:hypothetical protein